MKVLLIEDSPDCAKVASIYLKEMLPNLKLFGPFKEEQEIIKAINTIRPDIAIVDVELGKSTSFDILRKYQQQHGELSLELIFVTGHPTYHYALKALELSALCFLNKPLSPSKFKDAIEKASMRVERHQRVGAIALENQQRLEMLMTLLQSQGEKTKRVSFHQANGSYYFCDIDTISHLIADRDLCDVYFTDKTKIKAFRNLGYYKNILETEGDFFSISKSCYINLSQLRSYAHGSRMVIFKNGMECEASRRGGQFLKEKLESQNFL